MSTAIYKPGQGYYTRLLSAIGLAALTAMGAAWLWKMLGTVRIDNVQTVFIQAGGAVLLIGVIGVVCYWLIGRKPRVVEFMIATESEMKKVNWSSRQEIAGSTWVVIGLTVFLAVICFVCDFAFAWIFQGMGVLET